MALELFNRKSMPAGPGWPRRGPVLAVVSLCVVGPGAQSAVVSFVFGLVLVGAFVPQPFFFFGGAQLIP